MRSGEVFEGRTIECNSTQLEAVKKADTEHAKITGPMIEAASEVACLVIFTLFLIVWRIKRRQKKAEKDTEKSERDPVESTEDNAGETKNAGHTEIVYLLEP